MSPDNVFASQMWNWPDPVLKRDEFGRIIFLNAAFLSLYGGRVEDWQGNTVMGWPAPQMSTEINRFETRLPTDAGEFVFDWIEYAQGHGQALAIARDVTAFVTPPANESHPPHPIAQQEMVQNAPNLAPEQMPEHSSGHTSEPAPQGELVSQLNESDTPPSSIAETSDQSKVQAQTMEAAPQEAMPQDNMMSMVPEAPIDLPVQAQGSDQAPSMDTAPARAAPAAEAPIAHENAITQENAPQAEPVNEVAPVKTEAVKRDFERRALPIENQDAVLGTNWRDAVIARAVSNEDTEDTSENENSENEKTPTPQTQEAGSGYRILLAEDNAINALLTRTLLEAEGCTVDVVEDGALAVEAVKNATYDMIFMDMRMPNMDGLESTRKIRALPNTSGNLPIIALTANAFDDDRNACFDSGMNDFMTKPVSAEELSAMVQTWAEKSKAA